MGTASETSILVVDTDRMGLSNSVMALRSAGYQVDGVGTFDEARKHLDSLRPGLLITEVRLGAYNGIHLIVRSRASRPEMAAILTNRVFDAALQREATNHRATFLVTPCSPEELVEIVVQSVKTETSSDESLAMG